MAVMNKAIQKRRQVKTDLNAEYCRRVEQFAGALHELRRPRAGNNPHFVQKSRSAWNQAGIRSLRHLPRDYVFRGTQPGPVIVCQPQRYFDVQNVQQFDEVVGPAGRDCARSHGIFKRQVPADNPREELA
jgi:hypothetical protein